MLGFAVLPQYPPFFRRIRIAEKLDVRSRVRQHVQCMYIWVHNGIVFKTAPNEMSLKFETRCLELIHFEFPCCLASIGMESSTQKRVSSDKVKIPKVDEFSIEPDPNYFESLTTVKRLKLEWWSCGIKYPSRKGGSNDIKFCRFGRSFDGEKSVWRKNSFLSLPSERRDLGRPD